MVRFRFRRERKRRALGSNATLHGAGLRFSGAFGVLAVETNFKLDGIDRGRLRCPERPAPLASSRTHSAAVCAKGSCQDRVSVAHGRLCSEQRQNRYAAHFFHHRDGPVVTTRRASSRSKQRPLESKKECSRLCGMNRCGPRPRQSQAASLSRMLRITWPRKGTRRTSTGALRSTTRRDYAFGAFVVFPWFCTGYDYALNKK